MIWPAKRVCSLHKFVGFFLLQIRADLKVTFLHHDAHRIPKSSREVQESGEAADQIIGMGFSRVLWCGASFRPGTPLSPTCRISRSVPTHHQLQDGVVEELLDRDSFKDSSSSYHGFAISAIPDQKNILVRFSSVLTDHLVPARLSNCQLMNRCDAGSQRYSWLGKLWIKIGDTYYYAVHVYRYPTGPLSIVTVENTQRSAGWFDNMTAYQGDNTGGRRIGRTTRPPCGWKIGSLNAFGVCCEAQSERVLSRKSPPFCSWLPGLEPGTIAAKHAPLACMSPVKIRVTGVNRRVLANGL